MPFAVEMFLDPESAEKVRGVWRDLAESGSARWLHESGARPHVTLGVCDRLDVDACAAFLADFAAANRAPSVRFSSIGVFATDPATVFLAPVVTADLLDLHARFHDRFPRVADDRWGYYLPEAWVPHCTLAMECPIATIPHVIDICRTISLPLDGWLVDVGMVEFRPVALWETFRFSGT